MHKLKSSIGIFIFIALFTVSECSLAITYSELTQNVNIDNAIRCVTFDPCVLVYIEEKEVIFKHTSEVPDLTDTVRTGVIKRPFKVSELEFDELVRIGWCEAGLEGFEGICLVYDTVLNRVKDPRFPSCVYDVLHAPGQYSTVNTKKFRECKPSKECYEALRYVLNNGVTNKSVLYFGRSPITNKNVFKHNHHHFSS